MSGPAVLCLECGRWSRWDPVRSAWWCDLCTRRVPVPGPERAPRPAPPVKVIVR